MFVDFAGLLLLPSTFKKRYNKLNKKLGLAHDIYIFLDRTNDK